MRLVVVDDFPRRARHNAPLHTYHGTSYNQGRLLLLNSAPLSACGSAIVDVACAQPLHLKIGERVILRDHD